MVLDGWTDPDEAPSWDLDPLCPGGPGGDTFHERVAAATEALRALAERAEQAGPLGADADTWSAVQVALDALHPELGELGTFAHCAASANSRSAAARAAEATMDDLRLLVKRVHVAICAALDDADDAGFEAFVRRPELAEAAPMLRHDRAGRAFRLAPELERLRTEMEREALLGWGRLYDQLSGQLEADLTVGGVTRRVSVAQLAAMRADPDPEVRSRSFAATATAWRSVRDICAHTLTQITGQRLAMNDRLGVDELASSLHDNRIERGTLDAMWAAADAARPGLVRYLAAKARLLGTDGLAWHDLDAPVGAGRNVGWGTATRWIGEAFAGFHPKLTTFAREALDGRWIDAAPAPGRRPGGFCAGAPRSDQSRIFLTFTGSIDNATTLAHELGHAYHNRVLANEHPARQQITSGTAETASTFAEAVFRDQLLARAEDPGFRLFVLEQQLSAATAFLMDIPHRFAIERKLYALRREGVMEADQLDELAVACQREAYAGALATWNPTFWSSKLHFYIPTFGFYNWTYTFGYLFSGALHARAREAGREGLALLEDVLLRTGWQGTEDLAREALGVDLGDPAFWVSVVRPLDAMVEEFEALAG
ncbi:MAG: hypothetical protein H6738_04115 [Alphaproteobacteria bacterium]|nr:hypothetical protein [Alphaproteobacteria bacterium]MCB9695956.1 hypothetical protein [Alphaproteobacteria bacterium]